MAHPLLPGPDHPCPASGVPAAAVFLAKTLGKTFTTGAQLASHIRPAPLTPRSGSSIPGEYTSHAGNKRLNAPCSSRLSPPPDRTLPPGRTTSANATKANALTHRHIPTLYAILRNSTLHHPQPAHQLTTTA